MMNTVKKYRKKPVVVEAIYYDGHNVNQVVAFMGPSYRGNPISDELIVQTLEGALSVDVGDYVIKGVRGECYPCQADIFLETYELEA